MSETCVKEVLGETSWVNLEENHNRNLKVVDAEDSRGSPNTISKMILQDKAKSCDDKSKLLYLGKKLPSFPFSPKRKFWSFLSSSYSL